MIIISLPFGKFYAPQQRMFLNWKKEENNSDLFHDVVAHFNDGLWAFDTANRGVQICLIEKVRRGDD